MKIIIFGTGHAWEMYKNKIKETDEIVALVDNEKEKWNQSIAGISINSPSSISYLSYDCILIMAFETEEIYSQLISLGVDESKIIHFRDYVLAEPPKICFNAKKKALLITPNVGYHGSFTAIENLAKVLVKVGYQVCIGSPSMNKDFNEIIPFGVFVYKYDFYNTSIYSDKWIDEIDLIIFNSSLMIWPALVCAKYKETHLWVHESTIQSLKYGHWKKDIKKELKETTLKIWTVSDISKMYFSQTWEYNTTNNLEYAIEDFGLGDCLNNMVNKETFTFAIIGTISYEKGQDLFIKAIENLPKEMTDKCEFWIIGDWGADYNYNLVIQDKIKQGKNLHYMRAISHSDLCKFVNNRIDCLVVASKGESMSLVATEAGMLGKVCILTDKCGMALYLKDCENALLVGTDDYKELASAMKICCENPIMCKRIGDNARLIYIKNFSLDCLEQRLKLSKII